MNVSSGDYKDDFITIIPKDMNWVVSDSKFLAKFHVFLESDADVTRAELLQFLEERASKIINSQNSSLEILGIEVRDVNECETEEHLCDYHAACHNTQGSYMCQCDDGYTSLDSNWMGTQCMGVIYDDVEATPSIALMAVILGAVACGLFLIVMLALIVATMVQRRWQQASAVNTVLGTAIYPRLNCSDLSQFTVSPPLPSLWRSPASPTSRSGEERYQEAESCGCGWHPNSPAATRMHVCKR
uniref:EGF-like domain-containing protein n=1 Tax=Eptatretus burgeri TaxID=7764 RepID=A0A8C4QQ27_EPTBU